MKIAQIIRVGEKQRDLVKAWDENSKKEIIARASVLVARGKG